MNFKSEFLCEFFARGFFAQATHIKELDEILARQSVIAYIGFDCTAKSLHAGSLIQIMILRLLQKHGHKPIVLLGGGTTKIGDPSGKDQTRQFLSQAEIEQNLQGIKKTLEKFISFEGKNAALLVNNDTWLKNLNYVDFLRHVGQYFSINRMLTFDAVKTRLEREQSLSFLEFNYMILQAYDFYELNKKYGCQLQIGGSDQWGNIVNGVELCRKISGAAKMTKMAEIDFTTALSSELSSELGASEIKTQNAATFGLTSLLLTTADGKKMGKTSDGAVWLDEKMLTPFDYFQYFRNTHDADVAKFLRLFSDLEITQIQNLEKLSGHEINHAKEVLAFEATKICHGQKNALLALQKAQEIFAEKNPEAFEIKEILSEPKSGKKLTEIIKEIGAADSNSQAKKLIEGRGVKINGKLVLDAQQIIKETVEFDLAIGKKKFFKIVVKNSPLNNLL
jgi:tyrosyl-tRNA synthetase